MKKIISILFSVLIIFSIISLSGCKGIIKKELNKMENIIEGTSAPFTTKATSKSSKKKIVVKKEKVKPKYKAAKGTYKVTAVIDGDTFKCLMNGKNITVRLIGIDTPESVHTDETKNCYYGKIASKYSKSLLKNKYISLKYDKERYDKYGRTLAYVYLDGEFINEKLVAEGHAVAKEYPPNVKYAKQLKKAQIRAEKKAVGMWDDYITIVDCPLKETNYIEY